MSEEANGSRPVKKKKRDKKNDPVILVRQPSLGKDLLSTLGSLIFMIAFVVFFLTGDGMYKYPHYVEYAVKEIVSILLELNGLEDNSANRAAMENKFRTSGYSVKLAIDTNIQETVEDTLQN